MRVFVTGGSGFLGSAVVRSLLREGHEVRAIVRPSSERQHLDELGVDVVVGQLDDPSRLVTLLQDCEGLAHIAGAAGSFYLDQDVYYQSNVVMTANVFAAAKQVGVQRSVYCGSVVVPQRLDSPYGLSKRLGMQVAMAMADDNLCVTAVHPSGMIGPQDRKPTPLGQAVITLVEGHLPLVVGGGSGYIDVDDAADMHVAALTHGENRGEYIANTEYLENRVLYRSLARKLKQRPPLIIPAWIGAAYAAFDEPRARRQNRAPAVSEFTTSYLQQGKTTNLDGEADRQRLGLKAHKEVMDSFVEAIEWFRENDYIKEKTEFGPSRA